MVAATGEVLRVDLVARCREPLATLPGFTRGLRALGEMPGASAAWRTTRTRLAGLALLTPRDIVQMLQETLPRKPEGKDALGSIRDMNADAAPSHRASALNRGRRPRDGTKRAG